MTHPSIPEGYTAMPRNYPVANAALDRPMVRALTPEDDMLLAERLAKSRAFKGVVDPFLALAKITVGREYGLGPGASLMQLSIVEGRPVFEYPSLLSFMRRSGLYDYDLSWEGEGETLAAVCKVWRIVDGKKVEPPKVERFAHADARRAGLLDKLGPDKTPKSNTYNRYPRNMLAARAVANAIRFHAPDALYGIPTYVAGELGDDDREPIVAEARVLKSQVPVTSSGETPQRSDTCEGCGESIPDDAPSKRLSSGTVVCARCADLLAAELPEKPANGTTHPAGGGAPTVPPSIPQTAPTPATPTPKGGEAENQGSSPAASPPASPAPVLPPDLLTAIGVLGDDVDATPDLANQIHRRLEAMSGGIPSLVWAHWDAAGVVKGVRPKGRQLKALVRNLETVGIANPPAAAKKARAPRPKKTGDALVDAVNEKPLGAPQGQTEEAKA